VILSAARRRVCIQPTLDNAARIAKVKGNPAELRYLPMRWRARLFLSVLFCAILLSLRQGYAQEAEDLTGLATAVCELPGLSVSPPKPWYSVPIESDDPVIAGCQMLWEEGDQYMGIMRLVSFDLSQRPEQEQDWERLALGFEAMVMEQMNFKLGDVLWKRDSLPVSGAGFAGDGRAAGFELKLEGVEHANEAHFMFFENATHKYVISLITPAKSVSPDIYEANTQAMGTVMGTLQPRT
jgi:hypothetical protein